MSYKIKIFTPVQLPKQKDHIQSISKILTLGSCFSDNIGTKLANHLFVASVNPFGTIFNPISIAKVLDFAIHNRRVGIEHLNAIGSRFFHYDFHSSFDNTNPQDVIDKINTKIIETKEFLEKMEFLILTFGTSIVYRLNEDNSIVSNCHKVPNKNFTKAFLSVDLMEDKMIHVLNALRSINPAVKVILTVSPVRHTKEGMIENSRSKSRLIDLCHRLTEKEAFITYFPAYEIMIDELRDYRYYGMDLIHPNEQAIHIIWNRFMDAYFDHEAIQKVKDISDLNTAKSHIPFDPKSEEHLNFVRHQKKKILILKDRYPEVNFQEYDRYFTT